MQDLNMARFESESASIAVLFGKDENETKKQAGVCSKNDFLADSS